MQTSLLKLLRPLFVLLLLIPAGCAKSPAGGGTSPASGPQLIVSMTVEGTINPAFYYYVLFNVNNTPFPGQTSLGPVPVVSAADYTGNGFAAGAFSNYVEFSSAVGSPTDFNYYLNYPVVVTQPTNPPTTITQQQSDSLGPGKLINASVSADHHMLTFQLPLAYLATDNDKQLASDITADNINNLQITFVTTNFLPVVGSELSTPKYFDTLYNNGQIAYAPLIVRDTSGNLMPSYYSSSASGYNGGQVSQDVNGGYVPVNGPISGPGGSGDATDLQITGWTIQLTSGS
jgi:hypothetical protein